MQIIESTIALLDLKAMAEEGFGDMVKAMVDVERGAMAVDGELHSDLEALLLENGSRQRDLWGINIYPGLDWPERIELDSLINLRPSQGKRTRGVDDPATRQRILSIVAGLLKP